MNVKRFIYLVEAEIEFTVEELELVWGLSRRHPDELLRFPADLPGFLTLWWNKAKDDGKAVVQASFSTLDTLCKILETGQTEQETDLWVRVSYLLHDMRDRDKQVNK